MADRVIQRNDTAARWQSINPVLATGEIGIEIDGAKGYKIGDGKTRWNDLPYPANPTNVVQELGNDENAVPSQKLVTEKLSELGSEQKEINKRLLGSISKTKDVLKIEGFVKIDNGKLVKMNSSAWRYSILPIEQYDYVETVATKKGGMDGLIVPAITYLTNDSLDGYIVGSERFGTESMVDGGRIVKFAEEVGSVGNATHILVNYSVTLGGGCVVGNYATLYDMQREINSKFIKSELFSDYYVAWESGVLVPYKGMIYSETPVLFGMSLVYKAFPREDSSGLAFYDNKGQFIKGHQALTKEQIIEVPENAVICKATIYNEDDVVFYGYDKIFLNLNKSLLDLKADTICLKGGINQSNIDTLNDLNDFEGNTIFVVVDNSIGSQVKNKPDNSTSFHIYTFSPINKSVVFQIFIGANGFIYMRSRWASWGEWMRIGSYDNIKKYIDDNIQRLEYDSVWNNVVTDGEYILNNGSYVNYGSFSIARGILKAGQKLIIKAAGYQTNVAMISVQSGDIYQVKVVSNDESANPALNEYSWRNDSYSDVQVAVSFYKDLGLQAWVIQDYGIFESGFGFLHNDNYIAWESGVIMQFKGLKYVEKPVSHGMKLVYKTTINNSDSRGLVFYDKYDAYISGFQTIEKQQFIDVPNGAVLCRATVNNIEDIYIYGYNEALAKVENTKPYINILSAFDNIVCVGDSLTFSQVYTSDNNSRQAKVPYPEALARMCGNQQTTFARPGATSLDCWNEFNAQIIEKDNAIAIIYLGTNYGVTDTLDVDIVGDNMDNWTINNLGAYCRFVKKFKDLGYKVLLLNPWITSGTDDSSIDNTQNAIRHIAERFQCAVMDVPKTPLMEFHYFPDLSGYNGVHYNDLGYSWFASQIIQKTGELTTEQMKWIIPND